MTRGSKHDAKEVSDADLDAAAAGFAGPSDTGKTLTGALLGKELNGSPQGMQEEIEMVIERLERG